MQAVMLYDGQCVLCRQSKRMIQWLDWFNRIEKINVQHESVAQRYPHLNKDDLLGEMHVVMPDGQVKIGFFAVRYLVRFLPLLWVILPLLYLPGMNWLGPRLYRQVARRRYTLNRMFGGADCTGNTCKIAPVNHRSRG